MCQDPNVQPSREGHVQNSLVKGKRLQTWCPGSADGAVRLCRGPFVSVGLQGKTYGQVGQTESQNCSSWKRPLRSPNPPPTMPTAHVPPCHISAALNTSREGDSLTPSSLGSPFQCLTHHRWLCESVLSCLGVWFGALLLKTNSGWKPTLLVVWKYILFFFF